MHRFIVGLSGLLLLLAQPGEKAASESDSAKIDSIFIRTVAPEPPPSEIPPNPTLAKHPPAFVAGGNIFNLPDKRFLVLLFDTPKAVLFESVATLVGNDDSFFYFHDKRLNSEWAFAKAPQDHFAGHAIWWRSNGDVEWKLHSRDAVMADFLSDKPVAPTVDNGTSK
jgi:hypothetical protein